ncbi:MAG: ABC transporter permease [Phycisphaerales bacterium]|nr:ABC transporter permease [Phycisphaerales bacterium]
MYVATGAVGHMGLLCYDAIWHFGRFVSFCLAVARQLFLHPARSLRWSLLCPQLLSIGTASVPVVALTGAFIGMILALEGYGQFAAIGQEASLGGVINVSVVKQIGPVLAAMMVAGRVGGALAAELGTMNITEQLDAMRVMAADPIRTLVVPRVVACVLMTPILTIYSDVLGSIGAWFIIVNIYGVGESDYWHFTANFIDAWDPLGGLAKSIFFGAAIGLISCYKGFHCTAGATGVGRAATSAFVAGFLAIIMINLVLAEFINTLYILFHGNSAGMLS